MDVREASKHVGKGMRVFHIDKVGQRGRLEYAVYVNEYVCDESTSFHSGSKGVFSCADELGNRPPPWRWGSPRTLLAGSWRLGAFW